MNPRATRHPASDDPTAQLRAANPVLARIIDAHPDFDPRAWLDELPPMDAFGALVFQVIGQQLSVQATRRILDRLTATSEGRMPTPTDLLAADPATLRAAGLSQHKIETLRTLASRFADGSIRSKQLRKMSDQDIEALLTAIAGIGPWTVHGMLIIAFSRPDVVLPGDLALRNVIRQTYHLDHLPSEDEVVRIAEPWRPYRGLATAHLFQAAFDRPGRDR